jgi:hypothetical protein
VRNSSCVMVGRLREKSPSPRPISSKMVAKSGVPDAGSDSGYRNLQHVPAPGRHGQADHQGQAAVHARRNALQALGALRRLCSFPRPPALLLEIDSQIAEIDKEEQQETHQLLGQRVPESSLVPIVQLSQISMIAAKKVQNLLIQHPFSPRYVKSENSAAHSHPYGHPERHNAASHFTARTKFHIVKNSNPTDCLN